MAVEKALGYVIYKKVKKSRMVERQIKVELPTSDIHRAHRLGHKINGKGRPKTVRFVFYKKRMELIKLKKITAENYKIRKHSTEDN